MKRTKNAVPELKRTKFKLHRTKRNLMILKHLRPGTRFVIPNINMHGTLLYANECRAHIQIDPARVKIKISSKDDIEFFHSKFLDICPDVRVYKED